MQRSQKLQTRLGSPLEDILRLVDDAALGLSIPYLLVGATARDLLLVHLHSIPTGRATADVDLVVLVEDWAQYEQIRTALMETGEFRSAMAHKQRLLHGSSSIPLDLIPFGGIEGPDQKIAWPPEFDIVMSTVGFREALAGAVLIKVGPGLEVRTASLAGLALLKILAWEERREHKDAHDLALLAANYLPAGQKERIFNEHADLLDEDDFDYDKAGARLLGRDISALAMPRTREAVLRILREQTNSSSELPLARGMAGTHRGVDHSLGLLGAILTGVEESPASEGSAGEPSSENARTD